MIGVLSTNITSPLGMTTEENFQAVKAGHSALKSYKDKWGLPEPFVGSLFDVRQQAVLAIEGFTKFESLAIRSIQTALRGATIDVTSNRLVFILSTTKGNIDLLAEPGNFSPEREYPGNAAKSIANALGITTEPIVVCNACISGVAAQVLALRLLETGAYDIAIVCGADCQNKFIVSGFQSFKALCDQECMPFDKNREGLNLGEAAATIIFSKDTTACRWKLKNGAIRNDANHISGPSRTGEGSYLALKSAIGEFSVKELSAIGVHGTATLYNDEMESLAIERAGASDIPLCALKGYYGHTMGAAGILETIIMMSAIDDGIIPATRGLKEIGVTGKISISNSIKKTEKQSFVKLLSGFGGCNGAVLLTTENHGTVSPTPSYCLINTHRVHITPEYVEIDGRILTEEEKGKKLLTAVYKKHITAYPKFYKMDVLSRLAFIASELLIQAEGSHEIREDGKRNTECKDRAVVLFNRMSSYTADVLHQQSIQDSNHFYPSPSVFVYTLPNITTGEIAIRNLYHGETSFYVLAEHNDRLMNEVINASFSDMNINSMITGWIDCMDDNTFEADMVIIKKQFKN